MKFLVGTIVLAAVVAAGVAMHQQEASPAAAQEGPRLAYDVVPEGNEAKSIGNIVSCASASVGDRFPVDIIVQDVQDLIAWELPVQFDPEILRVVERDTSFFLGSTAGNEPFDASDRLPSTSAVFSIGAVDIADPASPESGSGVLGRLTFEVLAEGTSPISAAVIDITGDTVPDRGPVLRDVEGELVDAPFDEAEIRVGESCPDSGERVLAEDSGSTSWIIIVAAAIVLLVAVLAGTALLLRRRPSA